MTRWLSRSAVHATLLLVPLGLALCWAGAPLGHVATAARGPGAAAASDTPAGLTNTLWQWQGTYASDWLLTDDPTRYTVTFGDDGTLAVQADCNRGTGSYTVDGSSISIGLLATTLALCPPGSLDSQFLQHLQAANLYLLQDGELYLYLPAGAGTMAFAAAPSTVPPPAGGDAVTGDVTYLERIALPPGSVVSVQLLDVSRADAPATVLGEQTIMPEGGPPYPFSIAFDPAAIVARNRYRVSARITGLDGTLLFISMEAFPVITGGNPTQDVEVLVRRVP
jgi:uncharacterized lipoprotein YbaY